MDDLVRHPLEAEDEEEAQAPLSLPMYIVRSWLEAQPQHDHSTLGGRLVRRAASAQATTC